MGWRIVHHLFGWVFINSFNKEYKSQEGAIIWFGTRFEGSRGAFWGIKEGKKDILWDMDIKVYVLDGVGMVTLYILNTIL